MTYKQDDPVSSEDDGIYALRRTLDGGVNVGLEIIIPPTNLNDLSHLEVTSLLAWHYGYSITQLEYLQDDTNSLVFSSYARCCAGVVEVIEPPSWERFSKLVKYDTVVEVRYTDGLFVMTKYPRRYDTDLVVLSARTMPALHLKYLLHRMVGTHRICLTSHHTTEGDVICSLRASSGGLLHHSNISDPVMQYLLRNMSSHVNQS